MARFGGLYCYRNIFFFYRDWLLNPIAFNAIS